MGRFATGDYPSCPAVFTWGSGQFYATDGSEVFGPFLDSDDAAAELARVFDNRKRLVRALFFCAVILAILAVVANLNAFQK